LAVSRIVAGLVFMTAGTMIVPPMPVAYFQFHAPQSF
jgi:hypothetical protein